MALTRRSLIVREVAERLSEPAEDVDELALAICQMVEAALAERDLFVIGATFPSRWNASVIYGPYGTFKQAEKAIGKLVSPGPGEGRAAVWQVKQIPEQ